MDYDEWLALNIDELDIEAAESGRDREYDYDSDSFYDLKYCEYIDNISNKNNNNLHPWRNEGDNEEFKSLEETEYSEER